MEGRGAWLVLFGRLLIRRQGGLAVMSMMHPGNLEVKMDVGSATTLTGSSVHGFHLGYNDFLLTFFRFLIVVLIVVVAVSPDATFALSLSFAAPSTFSAAFATTFFKQCSFDSAPSTRLDSTQHI
eukprot:2833905-Ditylum_brightwellii.AAC.1